jgi:hypothetical protein
MNDRSGCKGIVWASARPRDAPQTVVLHNRFRFQINHVGPFKGVAVLQAANAPNHEANPTTDCPATGKGKPATLAMILSMDWCSRCRFATRHRSTTSGSMLSRQTDN